MMLSRVPAFTSTSPSGKSSMYNTSTDSYERGEQQGAGRLCRPRRWIFFKIKKNVRTLVHCKITSILCKWTFIYGKEYCQNFPRYWNIFLLRTKYFNLLLSYSKYLACMKHIILYMDIARTISLQGRTWSPWYNNLIFRAKQNRQVFCICAFFSLQERSILVIWWCKKFSNVIKD